MTAHPNAVNDAGYRIGEDHHRAKLTDRDVRTMRRLREDDARFWTYRRLAEAFDCSIFHAEKICTYRRRYQTAVHERRGHP